MRRPSCVLSVRPDLTAIVCAHCTDEKLTNAGTNWAESHGYSVSIGICDTCKERGFPYQYEWEKAKRERREPIYKKPKEFQFTPLIPTGNLCFVMGEAPKL